MLGKDERDATDEEAAALEAAHGPFLPADGEGRSMPSSRGHTASCATAVSDSRLITFDLYNVDVIILP